MTKDKLLILYKNNIKELPEWINKTYQEENNLNFPFYEPYLYDTILMFEDYYKRKYDGTKINKAMTFDKLINKIPDKRIIGSIVISTVKIRDNFNDNNNSLSSRIIEFCFNEITGKVHIDSSTLPEIIKEKDKSINISADELYNLISDTNEFKYWNLKNLELAARYSKLNLELRNKLIRLVIIRLLANSQDIQLGEERVILLIQDINRALNTNLTADNMIQDIEKDTVNVIQNNTAIKIRKKFN